MSSPPSAAPLKIRLRPSRYGAGLHLVFYGTALVAVLALGMLPWYGRLLLAAAVIIAFSQSFRRHVLLRGRTAATALQINTDGTWELTAADGKKHTARLLPSTFAHPSLIVLNFRIEGRRGVWAVILLRDSTDAGSYRRLLMWLRQSGVK